MKAESILQFPYAEYILWSNALKDYLIAFSIFIAGLVILGVFKRILLRRLEALAKESETDIDDILIAIVNEINPPFYSFLAFYIGLQFIVVNELVMKLITAVLLLWVTRQVIAMVRVFIDRAVRKRLGEDDGSAHAAVQLLTAVFTFVLWVLGILLVLQNLGINVTSLIAGLGIGGLAVALALQSVLSDLFSSFSILFDKPFTVGDFIVAGGTAGTVEKIGIKTTRLRAVSGEQIVMSNTELTGAVIQNYKRMQERRVVFGFGVLYETSEDKLKAIPLLVEKLLTQEKNIRFMSAHFKEFGDSAYVYEVIYYVETADYYEYLRIHNDIAMQLIDVLAKEQIEMAYPTQRLYLSNVSEVN